MPRGLAQALDIVEGTLFRQEDVDDKVDIVEQNPFALALALDGVGISAEFALHAQLDFISDGLRLPLVGPAGDEKEVGEAGIDCVELEDADVLRLLFLAGRCCRGHHLTGALGNHSFGARRGRGGGFLRWTGLGCPAGLDCWTRLGCGLYTASGCRSLRAR